MVDELKAGKCVHMSEHECVSKYVSICMSARKREYSCGDICVCI